jgi:hypothetical protein
MYDSLLLTTATLALLMQSGDKATSRAIATEALQWLGNLRRRRFAGYSSTMFCSFPISRHCVSSLTTAFRNASP